MIDLWQKVIALAISIAGILTTIYRMVFVKRKRRQQAYYQKLLKLFIKAYHENNHINAVEFINEKVERNDDDIPKYIFYLMDQNENIILKQVLIYDYFDLYHNDGTMMIYGMRILPQGLIYILFIVILLTTIYSVFNLVMSGLTAIIKLIYAGSITEVYLKEVIMRTAKSIFIIVLDCIGLAMVYIMDDDIYTFDKKKIKKIINKKVKGYYKHMTKYIF